jgi:hypothetical protein
VPAVALPGNDAPGGEAGLPDGATNPGEAGGFGAESDSSSPSSPSDAGLWASVSKSGPPAWSGPSVSGTVTVVQAKVVWVPPRRGELVLRPWGTRGA